MNEINNKIVFKNTIYPNKKCYLDERQMELLALISFVGFVSGYDDLQKLWYLLQPVNCLYQHSNKQISNSTINKWCKRGFLLHKTKVSQHHAIFTVNRKGKYFLKQHHLISDDDISIRNINEHNILLNHLIINVLYKATQYFLNNYPTEYQALVNHHQDNQNAFFFINYVMKNNNHLISNDEKFQYQMPVFVHNIDVRSYNQQLGLDIYSQSFNLIKPDALISFRNLRLYFELDNLTETNQTLLEKVKTYIQYAHLLPDRQMKLFICFNDGSIKNSKVTTRHVPHLRMANLMKLILKDKMILNKQSMYIYQAYQKTTNLQIFLSPISDTWVDVCDCMLGNQNINLKNTVDIWNNCHQQVKLNVITKQKADNFGFQVQSYLAKFGIVNTAHVSQSFEVFLGQEHLIDSAFVMFFAYQQAIQKDRPAPCFVFPKRSIINNQSKNVAIISLQATVKLNKYRFNEKNKYQHHFVGILQSDNLKDNHNNLISCITNVNYEKLLKLSIK